MDCGYPVRSILATSPHLSIRSFTEPRDHILRARGAPVTVRHVQPVVGRVYPGWCREGWEGRPVIGQTEVKSEN